MDHGSISMTLTNKLFTEKDIVFDSQEEYFFVLGQFLIYAFSRLGGIHKYRKEFNYLTNPYLPQNVQQLGIRVVRFITKLPKQLTGGNDAASFTAQALIKYSQVYCHAAVDILSCTEAFFEGIHSNNLFTEFFSQ